MTPLALEQLNAHVAGKQGFHGGPATPFDTAHAKFTGVYGASPSSYLSILARAGDRTYAQIAEEIFERHGFARFRAMRGSLFLVAAPHVPTVLQATKDTAQKSFKRVRQWIMKLGVREKEIDEVGDAIERIIAAGPKTPGELRDQLPKAKDNPTISRAFQYIVHSLCYEKRLIRGRVRGGWRSNNYEYARFHEWCPGAERETVSVEAAEAALAALYFQAFGPATEADFRWWSGFSKPRSTRALAALEPELAQVKVADHPGIYWIPRAELAPLAAAVSIDALALLPAWDAYLMAYRDRDRIVDPKVYDQVFDRAGNATSVILQNGHVVGLWQVEEESDKKLAARACFFRAPPRGAWKQLESAAERIAGALAIPEVTVERAALPPKLTSAPNNQFLYPFGKGAAVGETEE